MSHPVKEAFDEFPEWFNKNIFKNVHIEHPFSVDQLQENDCYIFDFNLFNNNYKVRVMLSYDKFSSYYRKRCYEIKEITFHEVADSILDEFWMELRSYVKRELRGKSMNVVEAITTQSRR